jgi:uncharacterized membrane protein YbhN (UPF0104 family)
VVGYVVTHWEEVVRVLTLEPRWLGAALAAELALVGLRAATLRETCRPFGVHLGRIEAVSLVSWASLVGYVATAAGGMGVRAAYLKRRHGLDLAGVVSLISALYALQFLLLSVGGLVATTWVGELDAEAVPFLRLCFGSLALASAGLLLWPFPTPTGDGFVARTVRRVVSGWQLMRRGSLGRLGGWLLLYVAVGWAATLAYFRLFGWTLEAGEGLLVSTLSEVSVVVAVAPAGLGVLESALALGARLAGAPVALGLAVAGSRRLVTLLVSVVLASLRSPWRVTPARAADRDL